MHDLIFVMSITGKGMLYDHVGLTIGLLLIRALNDFRGRCGRDDELTDTIASDYDFSNACEISAHDRIIQSYEHHEIFHLIFREERYLTRVRKDITHELQGLGLFMNKGIKKITDVPELYILTSEYVI